MRRQAGREWLQKLPWVAGLEPATLERLAHQAEPRRFAAKEVLFREGSEPEYLFALLSGAAELYTAADEREPAL